VTEVHPCVQQVLNGNIHDMLCAAPRSRGTNWLAAPPAFIIN
jgi:hypothetical protein